MGHSSSKMISMQLYALHRQLRRSVHSNSRQTKCIRSMYGSRHKNSLTRSGRRLLENCEWEEIILRILSIFTIRICRQVSLPSLRQQLNYGTRILTTFTCWTKSNTRIEYMHKDHTIGTSPLKVILIRLADTSGIFPGHSNLNNIVFRST